MVLEDDAADEIGQLDTLSLWLMYTHNPVLSSLLFRLVLAGGHDSAAWSLCSVGIESASLTFCGGDGEQYKGRDAMIIHSLSSILILSISILGSGMLRASEMPVDISRAIS